MHLNLGRIYTDGKLQNHRTWIKIICNPVLRIVGFEIASMFEQDVFIRYQFRKCPRKLDFKSSWVYILNDNQIVK
jgi:hypothetical protein